jgi:hypothetical protein
MPLSTTASAAGATVAATAEIVSEIIVSIFLLFNCLIGESFNRRFVRFPIHQFSI